MTHGIGYLSEDRKRFGLAVNLSVRDNLAMATYDAFPEAVCSFTRGKVRQVTQEYIA